MRKPRKPKAEPPTAMQSNGHGNPLELVAARIPETALNEILMTLPLEIKRELIAEGIRRLATA